MSPCDANPKECRDGRRTVLLLAALGMALAGCESLFKAPEITTTARKLPTLKPPSGSMRLDVMYVERPVGDRLLGKDLWQYVDQVASIDAEARGLLRQNGLRVGIVGADPPKALQRMLGLKSDFTYEPDAEQAKRLVGRHFFLVSGGDTEIQVSPPYAEGTLNLISAGAAEPLRFENAVCKFKMRATRLQDGWIQLEFVPQVSYGDDLIRPVVGDAGWRYQSGQQTETFFLHGFSIKMGTGEMAILTAEEDAPGTLGQLFFRGPAALRPPRPPDDEAADREPSLRPPVHDHPIQRLLIVRLAGMDASEPVFSKGR